MSGQTRVLFDSEERMDRSEVARMLRELADRVEAGEVELRQGEQAVTATIPSSVVLEVKLEEKERPGKAAKHSLEVELEWVEGDQGRGGLSLG